MAELSWPFFGSPVNDETQWSPMAKLWAYDGVVYGSGAITLGSGLSFIVPDGFEGWVQGAFYRNEGALPLTATDNNNTNPRRDQLVLRLNRTTRTITAQIVQGTPAASPSLPALTQNATVWEIPVAHAWVPGSATAQNYSGLTANNTWAGERVGATVRRGAVEGTVSSSGADVAVLELSVPVQTGQLYDILLQCHPGIAGGASAARVQIRHTTNGSIPTTTSPIVKRGQAVVPAGALSMVLPYPSTFTGTLRLLLCIGRNGSTGTAELFADSVRVTDLQVIYRGPDPGNTAT